ncbi:MAG: 16S rRNA (guanine(527)-N(7))-methyltransferase RsmG [Oscillospiraceae bacterium]
MEEILTAGLGELGLTADAGKLAAFRRYYDRLTETNAVMNLTAIEGEENTARLHFLDCCALAGAAELGGKSVVDVGTGAGFPGLPLKIIEPTIALTLIDSQEKRVDFLRSTCAALGMDRVSFVSARAEDAPAELRGSFDVAVSRAVARLNVLAELCLPLVRVGGLFIAMKGPDCDEEISEAASALTELGAELSGVFRYSVPGTDISHAAVIIKKIAETPEKYPRRWARITKRPL